MPGRLTKQTRKVRLYKRLSVGHQLGQRRFSSCCTRLGLCHGVCLLIHRFSRLMHRSSLLAAVRQFGAAPGARCMLENERKAAQEAISSGVYVLWRCQAAGDFCTRIHSGARCLCGHSLSDHPLDRLHLRGPPPCSKCRCPAFCYVPSRPEEVGDWHLPRRLGFDVSKWRPKCQCGHTCDNHRPEGYDHSCSQCRCLKWQPGFACLVRLFSSRSSWSRLCAGLRSQW